MRSVPGVMEVDEIAQPLGEIHRRTASRDFGIAPRLVRIHRDEDIRCAVPPVLVVVARGMSRDRRQRGPDFANELLGRFVDADDGSPRARQRRVEAEHVLHARDVRGIDLRHAPHLFLPRFEVVRRQAAADGRARNARMRREPDDCRREQRQRPARPPGGRLRARRRDQEGFFCCHQFPFPAGRGPSDKARSNPRSTKCCLVR